MLKLLFAGGGITGFTLAMALGLGISPSAISLPHGSSSHVAAEAPAGAPVTAEPTLVAKQPVAAPGASPAVTPVLTELANVVEAAPATSAPATTSGLSANQVPGGQSLAGSLTEITNALKGGGKGSDFNTADLLKMLGQGR